MEKNSLCFDESKSAPTDFSYILNQCLCSVGFKPWNKKLSGSCKEAIELVIVWEDHCGKAMHKFLIGESIDIEKSSPARYCKVCLYSAMQAEGIPPWTLKLSNRGNSTFWPKHQKTWYTCNSIHIGSNVLEKESSWLLVSFTDLSCLSQKINT